MIKSTLIFILLFAFFALLYSDFSNAGITLTILYKAFLSAIGPVIIGRLVLRNARLK
jgi:hypothetical protein